MSEDYKVIYTKDGVSESYNPSYDIDKNIEGYSDYISIFSGGETYYVPLTTTNNDNSKITYNGKYLSNGRYSDLRSDGNYYVVVPNAYTRNVTNNWRFGFEMDNRGGRLDTNLLADALQRVNSAFPSANIRVVDKVMKNYIVLGEFQDSWVGLCTNEEDRVKVELDKNNLISAYGEFNSDKTTAEYKRWLSTVVHELGHTFGMQDQASHTPSLYSYNRNREKALYLQANDIKWLRHAYVNRGASEDIFETKADGANIAVTAVEEEPNLTFDYPSFDSEEALVIYSDNIVTATLTFTGIKKLNVGTENEPKEIDYNIYTINAIDEIKGTLTNKQLKIPTVQSTSIEDNITYKLYLKTYTSVPCSLVNTMNGFVKID